MLLNKVCLIYLNLNSTSSKTVWTVCAVQRMTKKRNVIYVSHHQLQRLLHMYAYICWQQHVPKDWGSCWEKNKLSSKNSCLERSSWTGPLLTGDSTMVVWRKGHPWLAQSITSEYGAEFVTTVQKHSLFANDRSLTEFTFYTTSWPFWKQVCKKKSTLVQQSKLFAVECV